MPQFCIPFYTNYTILATHGGPNGPMPPPLNTPLFVALDRGCYLASSIK